MQTSPSRQQRSMPAQTLRLEDRMTGSNPVSPSSSGSPASSGGMSPLHLGHLMNDSLDGSSGFDTPRLQTRALAVSGSNQWDSPQQQASKEPKLDKNQTDILEQAKHEAKIENRIAELKKEGFWSTRRLSKVPEPTRPKVHWDYLCEEMQWLAADFAQERRWKRGVARKVVRMVIRHHEDLKQKEEKAKRDEQAKLRRIAASVAKEVRQFWTNVEKVVQFKQQSRLEEKRKKTLDLQLDFIVGQTEKYSDLLTQSLNETLAPSKTCSSLTDSQTASTASSPLHSAGGPEDEDGDFQPQEEEDDEETIEVEEQQDGNDLETQRREIEQLKRESELPLEELLQTLPQQILASSSSDEDEEEAEADDDEEEDDDEDEEEPFKAFQVRYVRHSRLKRFQKDKKAAAMGKSPTTTTGKKKSSSSQKAGARVQPV